MKLELTGKAVLVTGGGRGIGRALVDAFVAEGAQVVSIDREVRVRDDDDRQGVVHFHGDLTDPSICEQAVALAAERFGGVDVLVNNAGRNDGVGLAAGPAAFAASVRANLQHYYSMVHFARAHLERTAGAIVNIGSKVAVTGQGGTSGYAAAKGAVMALTREWALELAPAGVRVNAVLPAEVWTPMYEQWLNTRPDPAAERQRITQSIPLGRRFTTAAEIADTVLFLASVRSSHTTGQIMFVDGGYTHLDRRAGC